MANSDSKVSNPEVVNEPGDVITEKLEILTSFGVLYDVSNFYFSLSLYEDMFSHVMSGEIILMDSGDLVNILKFGGAEYITISYRTPTFDSKITKSFYITSVSDRFFSSTDKRQMFTVGFVSIEAQKDNTSTISKKYSGSPDSIVSKVYNEYLKSNRFMSGNKKDTPFNSVASKGNSTTLVVPFWSPLKTINWVSNRSFATGDGAPNYLFFESNKAFYFTSIEEIIKKNRDTKRIYSQFIYFPGASINLSDLKSNFMIQSSDLMQGFYMVRAIKPFKQMDVLEGQTRGYYASHLTVKDPTLKTFHFHNYDHYSSHEKFNHLEDYKIQNDAISPVPSKKTQPFSSKLKRHGRTYKALHTRQYQLHNDSTDPLFEKWSLQRNSLLQELHNIHLEIEVPGRTDIEVGMIIEFLFPKAIDKPDGMAIEDAFDPYMSGLYLITAIKHYFSLNKHTMYLEIAKESFKTPL